jgi:hypothetical protein
VEHVWVELCFLQVAKDASHYGRVYFVRLRAGFFYVHAKVTHRRDYRLKVGVLLVYLKDELAGAFYIVLLLDDKALLIFDDRVKVSWQGWQSALLFEFT